MNKIFFMGLATTLLGLPSFAQDVSFNYQVDWEDQVSINQLQSIEGWEQPRTQYTPKNLKSEQQLRFSGKGDTYTYESYTMHLTDYDTRPTQTTLDSNGNYRLEMNSGEKFITGKNYDGAIDAINQDMATINNNVNNNRTEIKRIDASVAQNTKQIYSNTKQIQNNTQRINAFQGDINNLNNSVNHLNGRIDSLRHDMKAGLATVTALTSLHPNPRATEKLELSIGSGIYQDRCAGAIGLFYHPNDRIQIMAGGAYGGDSQFAGSVGVTVSIGGYKKEK